MGLIIKAKISKSAYKLFFLYLTIFYLIPFFAHLIYPDEFSQLYQNTNVKWPLIIALLTIVGIIIFDAFFPKIEYNNLLLKPFIWFIKNDKLNFVVSVLFFVAALYFFKNFSINFRHKVSISQSGGIIMLLFFCRIYFKAYIFLRLIRFYVGYTISRHEKRILLIVLTSFVLSLNSSWDAIFIFVLVIFLFGKEKEIFSTVLVKNIKDLLSKYFKLILLTLVLLAVVYIGYANKFGAENALHLFSQLEILFLKVIKRLSVWYISILSAGVNFFEDSSYAMEPLIGTFQSVFYRLGRIFGMDISKPEIWSVNRMNFLHLFNNTTNLRTGSSPGIFASVFYIPFFPINLAIIILYSTYVLRKFAEIFRNKKHNISFLGFFILLFFLIPLFESPVNLINFLDKGFIYFIFFIAAVKSLRV